MIAGREQIAEQLRRSGLCATAQRISVYAAVEDLPAGTLYREIMDDAKRDELVENIVGDASAEVSSEVQDRVVAYWTQVDAELGSRVASGLQRAEQAPTPPQAEVPSNV